MRSPYDDLHYPTSDSGEWLSYTCPRCCKGVSGAVIATAPSEDGFTVWVRCSACLEGAIIMVVGEDENSTSPPVPFGPGIIGLPPDVAGAYAEARSCMGVRAYTSAEFMCRKLLMHIAVDKGAKEGQQFAAYVTYLENAGYVTPPMKGWVQLIRNHGNVAAHELPSTSRQRAESTLMFTAELLRLVYEMEHMAQQYAAKPDDAPAEP